MEIIALYFASRTVLYSLSFYILSCVSISQENDVLRNRLFILYYGSPRICLLHAEKPGYYHSLPSALK